MWIARCLSLLTLLALAPIHAAADTQGLWLFESLYDTSFNVGLGDQTADQSGHFLHFTKHDAFGSVALCADVPSVAPAGSHSLEFNAVPVFDTPFTDLFSIGRTGELTVEFWYKPMLVSTVNVILNQNPGSQGHGDWSLSHTYPSGGESALDVHTRTSPGGTVARWNGGDPFITDQSSAGNGVGWTHLAVTFNETTGAMKVYRDGTLTDDRTGFTPYDTLSSTLRMGSVFPGGGFSGHFRIDDLRISDAALAPGGGTGVGELAWNASLSTAPAQAVGLYTFDTIADTTDAAGGERLFDDSGNTLHLTRGANSFGSVSVTSDTPAVAPAGSLALKYNGAFALDSPATTLQSIGQTGGLSVEFWYKPTLDDTFRYVLAQPNSNNGFSIYQSTPDTNGKFALVFDMKNDSGNSIQAATDYRYDADTDWFHFAATVGPEGVVTLYENGTPIAVTTGADSFDAFNTTTRLGAVNPDGTFSNVFLMDDLRISDQALVAGLGSGVGELAWNTSLSAAPNVGARPGDFAAQWIDSHDFTISSWGFTERADLFTGANFNAAMSGDYQAMAAAGVRAIYAGGEVELTDEVRTKIHIALNGGVEAFLIRDEIAPESISGLAQIADYIRSVSDDTLLIAGLGNQNAAYIDDVIDTIQPDAVIHGYYPYQGAGAATDDWDDSLNDVAIIRRETLGRVAYFSYIQSFEDFVASANPFDDRRQHAQYQRLYAALKDEFPRMA